MPVRTRRRRRPLLRDLVGMLVTAALVLVARQSLADHYVVPTGSMEPTVQVRDHVLVEKAAYGLQLPLLGYVASFGGPARGDVVVLTSPVDGATLLKRVVALPGDTVEVRGGQLLLGGRAVPVHDEGAATWESLGARAPHPLELGDGGGPDFGPVVVPAGHYLVMGDHRGDSYDGRMFGFVARDAIFGRAVGVIWRGGKPAWAPL